MSRWILAIGAIALVCTVVAATQPPLPGSPPPQIDPKVAAELKARLDAALAARQKAQTEAAKALEEAKLAAEEHVKLVEAAKLGRVRAGAIEAAETKAKAAKAAAEEAKAKADVLAEEVAKLQAKIKELQK
jgi:hypothetical protein